MGRAPALTAELPPELHNPYCRHGGKHRFCCYSPEQEAASASPAFELFFGGAAGPGKTIWLLNEGARQIDKRGYRAIFFRRTYRELLQVIEMSHESFPWLGGRYHRGDKIWRFPLRAPGPYPEILRGRQPGAEYQFAYCERDHDKLRYQGGAWAYIAWDELTQHPNDAVYTYLFLRCRPLYQGQEIDCYIRAASNPGGPGHSWVKQRFIEGREPGKAYWQEVRDPSTGKILHYLRQFIPALLDSNDILLNTTNYEMALLSYPDPELRRAMRHGDWDIAAGVMFAELRERTHLVEARPPLDWTAKEISMDWGYGNYAVAGWFETTSGGDDAVPHSILYREFVINQCPPPLFAQMVAERTPEDERIKRIVLDSAAWATPQDGGPSPAEQMLPVFKQRGWKLVPSTKGARSRVRGWHLLHTYFYPKRRGGPLLKVMDNCPVTWRQLSSLARGIEPHDVEDLEPHQEDDAADMVRYFVQSRPEPAPLSEAELLMTDEDVDKMLDPRTYEAAKIEKSKKAGFPAVPVRTARRTRKRQPPWGGVT